MSSLMLVVQVALACLVLELLEVTAAPHELQPTMGHLRQESVDGSSGTAVNEQPGMEQVSAEANVPNNSAAQEGPITDMATDEQRWGGYSWVPAGNFGGYGGYAGYGGFGGPHGGYIGYGGYQGQGAYVGGGYGGPGYYYRPGGYGGGW